MEILETERLVLRKPRLTDAADIEQHINHPHIAQNTLRIPYPYPPGAAAAFLRDAALPGWDSGNDIAFAITRREDGQFLGVISLHRQRHNRAEMGYWLGVAFWNQGYATEAVRRVIQFGFEEMGLHRIQAEYFTHNPASRRVMQKAGMAFEGVLRGYLTKGDGHYVDVGMCAILRTDITLA